MTEPDGRPTPGQLKTYIAGVFDRLAETYDNVGVDFFTTFGRRLVEVAGVGPGEQVLDVGCGSGAVTFAAAAAVGAEGSVTAIDLAPAMVERTARDVQERGLGNVTVRVGDAESPGFEPASFDVVLAGLVLFFLPDQPAALRAYRALLRDGGRLGLTTFPPQPDGGWSRVAKEIQAYLPGGATTRPDSAPLAAPEALEQALRDAGFADARAATEESFVQFRDLDHWWSWAWSQGQRAALERVPEDEIEPLRERCRGLLADETNADGSISLRQLVTYTVATA